MTSRLTAKDLPRYRAQLVGLARHLGLPHAAAEDAAQSCLLATLVQLQGGAAITEPAAYLKTALRHQCWRMQRRAARETSYCPEAHDAAQDDPAVEQALYLQEVLAALHGLPETQAALLRRVAEGETSPQVLAAETGLPVGTVMSRLARARAMLRALLEAQPDGASSRTKTPTKRP